MMRFKKKGKRLMEENEASTCSCSICGTKQGPFFIVSHELKSVKENHHSVSLVTNRICKSCQVISLKSLLMAANLIRKS